MDWALMLGLASTCVALLALCIGGYLAYRQARAARSQVVVSFVPFLAKVSDPSFIADVQYVRTQLSGKFPDATPVSELPKATRTCIGTVVNYFDQLGVLVSFGVLDEEIVIGYLGNLLDEVWRALQPHIASERRKRQSALGRRESISGSYLAFYEDLLVRALEEPPPVVQKRMKLRKLPTTYGSRTPHQGTPHA